MTDQQLRDEVVTIFGAGHETTANLLAWTWSWLSRAPQVRRALHAELDAVLGDRPATSEDYARLPYTRMVLSESLRISPPVWFISRRVVEPIDLGGHTLERGTLAFLSPYVTQRHPAFWENPEGFDPERFSEAASAQRTSHAYFPFGAGPRKCIGEIFALVEATLILATLARRFSPELLPGKVPVAEPVITLRPRGRTPHAPPPARARRRRLIASRRAVVALRSRKQCRASPVPRSLSRRDARLHANRPRADGSHWRRDRRRRGLSASPAGAARSRSRAPRTSLNSPIAPRHRPPRFEARFETTRPRTTSHAPPRWPPSRATATRQTRRARSSRRRSSRSCRPASRRFGSDARRRAASPSTTAPSMESAATPTRSSSSPARTRSTRPSTVVPRSRDPSRPSQAPPSISASRRPLRRHRRRPLRRRSSKLYRRLLRHHRRPHRHLRPRAR